MQNEAIHNPDHYMADLRLILSQGRKRIGLLIGAGAPYAVQVNDEGRIVEENGKRLLPDVTGLTDDVTLSLSTVDNDIINKLKSDLAKPINIETILTQIRKLSQAIGSAKVYDLDSESYGKLASRICESIGDIVQARLPPDPNPYSDLASWISGTTRDHAIEIFTPNYDLLIEEALERAHTPYFDGFSGSHRPFFDAASVATDELPSRWARLWKLHGSLGWERTDDTVVRTGARESNQLIYPDHLKYDQITRQPYSALFERLRTFLTSPDTLLLSCGFSFLDDHICAVIKEAMAANPHSAVFAFQFKALGKERAVASIARSYPNVSVYASDGAIVNGIEGRWKPDLSPNEEWKEIRHTFWKEGTEGGAFVLGDFTKLARFLKLTRAHRLDEPIEVPSDDSKSED